MGRLPSRSAQGMDAARASAEDVSRGGMSRAFSLSVRSRRRRRGRVGATATPIADRDDGPLGRGVEGVRTFASSTTNSSAGAMKTSETTSSAAEARAETTVDDGSFLREGAVGERLAYALSPAVRSDRWKT